MTKLKLTSKDRAELAEWNDLVVSIKESSDINPMDTTADIQARRRHLEKDPESWFRYYFEMYCTSEAAEFHKAATHRILTHERWYEVRAWSRELAKSARAMMEISYLALTGKIRNVLLISNSLDNAERLLLPFMANFEENQRIIQDYGPQRKLGEWETGEFTLRSGCSFRAIGAGQSPRGTRNKNVRPDFILIDDIDTDEECRNSERIKNKWKWLEDALIPAMSVSGRYRILFNGNIIAMDCCIKRAIEKAKELQKQHGIGHVDIINIRDKNGLSVWPAKNSEEDIDMFLSLISTSSAQKEFFNNPVSEGNIFKNVVFGKVPPLREKARRSRLPSNPSACWESLKVHYTSSRQGFLGERTRILSKRSSTSTATYRERRPSTATWRTTSCRTLSSSRFYESICSDCARSTVFRSTSSPTRTGRQTRRPVSRRTSNRWTGKETSFSMSRKKTRWT